jgi:drug/metabolite transporter (DMT)-like permease
VKAGDFIRRANSAQPAITKVERLSFALTILSLSDHSRFTKQQEKTMNKERLTQSTIEERRTLDTVINILLLFLLGLVGYAVGYYAAMREVSGVVKTILTDQQ